MPEPTTNCAKCGASILQSTADQNDGRCQPCSGRSDAVSSMTLGLRFLLGLIFGCLLGGLGYGIGSFVGSLVGVLVAIPFALIGFIYGCFCVEINAMIRSALPIVFDP